jgi:hypothetical protein
LDQETGWATGIQFLEAAEVFLFVITSTLPTPRFPFNCTGGKAV